MTQAQLTEFFGWMTIINVSILLIATLLLLVARRWITDIHSRFSGVGVDQLTISYFNFLANYKVLIIVLTFVPYLALKLMA